VALSRRVRTALYIALAVVLGLGITCWVLVRHFSPIARDYVLQALRDRYGGEVQLGDLQITLFPSVHAVGQNLTIRVPKRPQEKPLVEIRRFTVDAHFVGFFRSPKRISRLRLEGLQLHIPPHSMGSGKTHAKIPFILQEVIANKTFLETLPADPSKDPLQFQIEQLTMHHVGIGRAMTFHAELNNPKPPGFIHSDGEFGPWNQDDPAETPVDGKYAFSNADLSVFKSISGILSSSGSYTGKLNRIEVQGTTDVPDFALTSSGNKEHLRTRFQATVDGTNGDTNLHPVSAMLGESVFEVSGPIERNALETGKEIDLTATTPGTGLSDFLRLATSGNQPPMVGRIKFDTTVRIPPGETPVIRRLDLNGRFSLTGVKFTSADVQGKIASLSHRAQGDPKDTDTQDVRASFAGRFRLRSGTLTLPRLDFEVPGAKVKLDGTYAVESGDIDFKGTARLDATVSQMTTGVKHVLLKAIDPLFKRDGAGTVLPIRISGTRGDPSFKLDIGKALTRRDEN